MDNDRRFFYYHISIDSHYSITVMCVHKNSHTQVSSLMAISQSLTFTIWLLKLQRGLGLSLIRSCGAKSNQSKREQRAKPSPYKRVSVVRSV